MECTINYNSLKKILSSDDASRAIKYIDALYDYADFVMRFDIKLQALKNIADVVEYQTLVEDLDQQRRIKHNSAISALSILNRLAKYLEIEPIITHEIDDFSRGDIAFAIFELCKYNLDNDQYGINNRMF